MHLLGFVEEADVKGVHLFDDELEPLGSIEDILFDVKSTLMFVFNTSFLVVVSNSMTLIIDPHPKIAGSVSAFFGFVTSVGGALFVILTIDLFNGDAVAWGIGMVLTTGITFLGFMLTLRSRIDFDES